MRLNDELTLLICDLYRRDGFQFEACCRLRFYAHTPQRLILASASLSKTFLEVFTLVINIAFNYGLAF